MSTSKTGETYHHLLYLFLIFSKKPENSNAVPRFSNYFLTAAYSFITAFKVTNTLGRMYIQCYMEGTKLYCSIYDAEGVF